MKKFLFSLLLTLSICCVPVFAANDENYEELCDMISEGVFTGDIYSPTNSSSPLLFGSSYGDDWTSPSKVNAPKWFKYGKDYYLILETDTDKIEDDEGKKLNLYAITNYVEDGIAVVKWGSNYEAYYFDQGVCSAAITNKKNVKVTFDKNGKVLKGYEIQVDENDMPLPIIDKDDFDGKTGMFDKNTKEAMYDGYWIQDNGNDKYTLVHSNSSASTSMKIQNKSLSEIYTYINEKGYTQAAVRKTPNSSNSNTKTTTNTSTTITKSTNITDSNVKSYFSIAVSGGKLDLTPKDGRLYQEQGVYYDTGKKKYFQVNSSGYITAESTSKLGSNDPINITGSTVYKIGNNYILQGDEG